MMNLNLSKGGLIAASAVLFLALMILNNELLRGVRLDLTSNRLYTLSEGTRNILEQIEEPINLYLFFSEKETKDLPQLRNYYARVKEVLEEYSLIADGNLQLHYVNPEAFSEEEDRATQLGLQAVPVRSGDKVYFGVAGTNTLDTTEVIPFLQTDREAFLEYDLGKLIYGLIHVKKPVLGLMSTLPMDPASGRGAPPGVNPGQPWLMTAQLKQVFDVRSVETDAATIPREIEVLMVVHPKDLPEKTVYAIDQFIMRGGKGLFFIDPHADAEQVSPVPNVALQNPKDKSSNLNRLFRAWGFSVDADAIIGDAARGLTVSFEGEGRSEAHPAVPSLRAPDFNREDVVTDALESLNFYLASYVRAEEGADTELTPLVWTSKRAMPIPIQHFRFLPRPRELLRLLTPTGERYPLAARIQGTFESAFDGPPPPEESGEEDGDAAAEPPPALGPHLPEAAGAGVVTVVADADMLTDRMWAQRRQFFGRTIVQPFAGNRDFVINLVDNLFGSTDLISIRSRASYSRPFTRVREIEEEASRKYRDTEQSLQNELKETETKLQELQQERDDRQSTLLTVSQRQEVRKFREKKVEIRKKLRNVRHQLVKDIENLGARLKLINVITMPLIVTVAALIMGFVRVRRRKQSAAL